MIAIYSLLIVVVLSLLVTRIATMALTLTGLSWESARFQARSAFTGSGFTTSESESVVNHPVRRRIIMLLMLAGNIGIATVVATIVLSMINTSKAEQWWWYALMLIGGGTVLGVIASSRFVELHLNKLIALGLKKWTKVEVRDYIAVLQLHNGFAVTELKVEPGDWLVDKSLNEASLPREGVLVLGIQRSGGAYIGTPRGNDQIHVGDNLILYGPSNRLDELDRRCAGDEGECAHCDAITENECSLEAHDEKPVADGTR